MNKLWNKNQDNGFSFFIDNIEIGVMTFKFSNLNKNAFFHIGGKHFSISNKGFWNSILFITDISENVIAKLHAEKWYANQWLLEYEGKYYKLSVRNNPLAEYIITEGEKLILSYGLHTSDGKVQVKITGMNKSDDFIFDFLLWYLFAPVAVESMGDNLTFSLLFTDN
jgi:hypothetical protein